MDTGSAFDSTLSRDVIVLGASPNPDRYSYKAARRLADRGYSSYLIGKVTGNIGEQPIQREAPVGAKVDTLTLYVAPNNQASVEDLVAKHGIRRVIFNPGTENPTLENLLSDKGVECMEACTLVLLSIGQF